MKMKDGIKVKNVVVKCGADAMLPFAIIFGMSVIFFGTVSPGGGFQGGVCVAAAALMLYLAYGTKTTTDAINPEFIRVNEAIGAILYVVLALIGVFMGTRFCENVLKLGHVGDMLDGGTITFMSYAVGYKVLTGVGFLLITMLGLLAATSDDEEEEA